MLQTHTAALGIMALCYVLLGVTCYGWGRLVVHVLRLPGSFSGIWPGILCIWIGWAVTLLVFQILHFLFPVNHLLVFPVFAVGVVSSGIFLAMESRRGSLCLNLRFSRITGILGIFVLVFFVYIASRSMVAPTNYDSGFYHLNSIRWINTYPVVPGLGNLHGRLAFNQSFFTYVAALNLYPYFGMGRSVANSFVLILTFLTLLVRLRPLIREPDSALRSPVEGWLPALFALPVVLYWACSSSGLNSPSPDLTSDLLHLVIFVFLGILAEGFRRKDRDLLPLATVTLLLSATAITVKLSGIMFCSVVMVLVIAGMVGRTGMRPLSAVVCLVLPAVLILGVWMARGIIASGAPLYPSTLGYLETSWSVPRERVIEEANIIVAWGRHPWVDWHTVLGNSDWVLPWFQRILHFRTDVIYPFSTFLIGSLLACVLYLKRRAHTHRFSGGYWLLGLPLVAGLVFWFFNVPNPRFAAALFLLLPVAAMVPLVSILREGCSIQRFRAILGLLFLVVNFNYISWAILNARDIGELSVEGWHPLPRVPLKVTLTRSGLPVFTPVSGLQCWDAPLPCTPFFNENLSLRVQDDVSSGFTVVEADPPK